MKKTFSQRRVPRKVADDDEEPATNAADLYAEAPGTLADILRPTDTALTQLFLRRPWLTGHAEPSVKRPTAKPRKSSNLRHSLAPDTDEESEASGVVTPKRSNLSRIAVQRNAKQRASLLAPRLPARDEDDEDRPTYNASYLQELKNSTPTTPHDLSTASNTDVEDVSPSTQALDLSSKFGSSVARYGQSAIPSEAEIVEKKARRARLAKEQEAEEYISIDPDDPDLDDDDNVMTDQNGRLILRPKDKYGQAESRLVREDEDIMEGFDEFTGNEGNRIEMGQTANHEAARRRKAEMAAQIEAAEGSDSDSDSDASEKERIAAFEADQTRHGTYASNNTSDDPYADSRPKTPPKISPLPTLESVIVRLRTQLADMQTDRSKNLQEMQALQREKIRIGEEEVRIQKALKETAEKFEQLRAEKGIAGGGASQAVSKEGTPGLGNGTTPVLNGGAGLGFAGGGGRGGGNDDDYGEHDEPVGRPGLGMAGRGLESLGASAAGTPVGGVSESD